MEERGLAALIIRGTSAKLDSSSANIRYISQIGGNGEKAIAVFPVDGDPIVFIWASSQLDWWTTAQDWVANIRQGNPSWAAATVDCIKGLGQAKGRIGVVGIGGATEAGTCMSHDIYQGIVAGLPDAQLDPASDLMETVRAVKSAEEIEFMTRSVALCDIGIKAMVETAGEGVMAYEVFGEILGAIFRAGGESPAFLMFDSDPQAFHAVRMPSQQKLAKGDMLLQEILPKYAGYWSQVMAPVSVGEPDAEYQRLCDLAMASYEESVKAVRPGITLKQLADAMNAPIWEAGCNWARPQWQGLGLESMETPMGKLDTVPEEGMIIGLQPMAGLPDRSRGVQVGDTVVVTKDGIRKLGKAEMRLYVV